jgi:hypothetical protein
MAGFWGLKHHVTLLGIADSVTLCFCEASPQRDKKQLRGILAQHAMHAVDTGLGCG